MTIAELEARSGMTRANIRFYEAEGFIRPERRENGYRDYSEAELELLLRLKLLRALGLPLAEIRELQRGELGLSAALERHMGRLAQERRRLQGAETVCRDIFRSGESFESLDTERWLGELQAGMGLPDEDSEPKLVCPWRRYFARTLDFILCELLLLTPIMLVFRPNVDLSGFGVSVALVAGAILLMLLLEPLCLHLFGTTPGKALLGLHIERPDGGRLGYGEAARRTFDVLTYGLGFHVPILSQVLLICSWLRHRDGRPLRWEAGSELRLDKKRLGLLTVGYILLACLASFTGFVNEELSQMPKKPRRHHGGGVLRKLQRPRAHGRLFALVHLAHPRRMGAYEHEPDPARGTGLRGRVQLLRDRRRARKARTAPGENPRAHRHDFFDAGTGAGAQEQRMGPRGQGVLDFYERRMQLIDIRQMVNYGGSEPEDFRLELPSAVVTLELDGSPDSSVGLLMTIELV